MDGSFVEALAKKLPAPVVVKVNGIERLVLPNETGAFAESQLPTPEVMPATLGLNTLSGLVAYLRGNRDELTLGDLVVHVVSHGQVRIIDRLGAFFRQRAVYAQATCDEILGHAFAFGRYYELSEMLTALSTVFADAADRTTLIELLASISSGNVREYLDDGISQEVTRKSGVTTKKREKIAKTYTLSPYRTFRELEQPSSPFVLRLRGSDADEALPMAGLFEADGGAWKLEAIKGIAAYLGKELVAPEGGAPIVAVIA